MRDSPAFMRALAIVLVLAAPASTAAQEVPPPAADVRPAPAPEVGVETDVGSVYVFRGLVYSDGPVTQSKAWLSVGGLYLYAWINVAVPAAHLARNLDEVDLGASYTFERGNFTVAPAIDCYLYRLSDAEATEGVAARTAEVSVMVSYARGGAVLSTRHAVDAGSHRGAYFGELGASYDRAVGARTELGVSARMGWASARFNRAYVGPAPAGVELVGAGVSITRRFGKHLYVRPHADITTVPDAGLRAHLPRPTNGIVGLVVGVVR
ncbi:MAG: hypothetical protein AB7Q16_04455 [Vicinamibacterales bacterium]